MGYEIAVSRSYDLSPLRCPPGPMSECSLPSAPPCWPRVLF